MVQVAASLLAADFSRLGEEVRRAASADMLHIDVMDGCFVPNISVGPAVVKSLRDKSPLRFNVHLMLTHPLSYIRAFRDAGADSIAFHVEAADDPRGVIQAIKDCGALPCIALNPETPPEALAPYLPEVSLVTVMTVRPGFGGQALLPECLDKVAWLRARFPETPVQVDGGVNLSTAPACVKAGARVLVAGTAVFGAENPQEAIRRLKMA